MLMIYKFKASGDKAVTITLKCVIKILR